MATIFSNHITTTNFLYFSFIVTIFFFSNIKFISGSHGLGKEKLTHLHFYFHDIVSGRNPTAVRVAAPATSNKSKVGFGVMAMIDDPLTEGPDVKSKLLGRAQGMYGIASQSDEAALLVCMNFVFLEGKFNGSTITVLGRNDVNSAVREMPVIGGSGVFRFARGYVQARTHVYNVKTGDAVVEYNVFVFHY